MDHVRAGGRIGLYVSAPNELQTASKGLRTEEAGGGRNHSQCSMRGLEGSVARAIPCRINLRRAGPSRGSSLGVAFSDGEVAFD